MKSTSKMTNTLLWGASIFLLIFSPVGQVVAEGPTFVEFHQLESTGGIGRFLSLYADQEGNPQACYVNDSSTLRYARFTGSAFEFEDVATKAHYNSLALDPYDIPAVVYSHLSEARFQDREGGTWGVPVTLHAGYNTGTWARLRFASDGTAYAIFWTATQPQFRFLKRPPEGNWSIAGGPSVVSPEQGLAVGPDNVPRIITNDGGNSHLLFAEDLGGGLVFQDLFPLLDGRRVGCEKDIAVDTMGRVHISFFEGDSGDLWYGVRDSGVWSFEPVDTGPGIIGRLNRIGTAPDGTPYISYYHDPEHALKLARKTATGWFMETVASVSYSVSGTTLPHQDLHIDPSGNIYLLYWDSQARFVTLASSRVLIPNQPPTANAGENITISSEEITTTIIQGTATDEDPGDVLQYRWIEAEAVLLDWTSVGENGECPLDLSTISIDIGSHTLTLEVTDGQATSTDDMILTIGNSAPHAAPSGCGVYQVNTEVVLGGDVSDFDGDSLGYQWMEGTDVLCFGTIQTIQGGAPIELQPCTISNLSIGVHNIILQVDDETNDPVSAECAVKIVDTTEPTVAPVADQTILWPPNHKMVDIVIEANASDNSGLPVTLTAVVTSNEPIDGLGDGDMAPDWTEPVIDQDNGMINLQLRAERSGSGDGREYTIAITATDESDNSSTADVKIIVPHDKRKK